MRVAASPHRRPLQPVVCLSGGIWLLLLLMEERTMDDDLEIEGAIEDEEVVTPLDFIEKEAELSGDEGSSDEDEDDDDEEQGEEDADEDLPDEDEQRDQIARVFAKQQHDDDERQLLLYQERLFEDGQFHMDGKQRKRKFLWRKADNNVWLDQVEDSDEDEEEDEEPDEDEKSPELVDVYSQVKINVKEPGSEEGPTVTSVLAAEPPSRPTTAFSGPAGSILSYVVRDRKTVEFLNSKRASPQALLLKRTLAKKHKVRRLYN